MGKTKEDIEKELKELRTDFDGFERILILEVSWLKSHLIRAERLLDTVKVLNKK